MDKIKILEELADIQFRVKDVETRIKNLVKELLN